MHTLLGGWSFGGIYTYQSGTPFSILNPFDTVGTDGVIGYADKGAPFRTVDPHKNDRQAFNADAFQAFGDPSDPSFILARDFRRGTSGRNQSRAGNYINNFDLILSKKTRLWSESTGLELRLEAFNAMNHTQFTVIDTNLLSDTFGKFTGARESRVVRWERASRFRDCCKNRPAPFEVRPLAQYGVRRLVAAFDLVIAVMKKNRACKPQSCSN